MSKPLLQAAALLQRGRYDQVLELCRPLRARASDQFTPHHLYGVALLRLGRLQEAEKALQRASQCRAPRPQLAQACNNLALCLQYQGKLGAADRAICDALRHQPDEAAYWINRGNICEARGDWRQMRSALQRALTLAPALGEAHTGLAVANRQLGQLDIARTTLENSPEQDYDWLCEYVLVLLLQGATRMALGLCDQVPDCDSLQGVADYIAEAGHGRLAEPVYRRVQKLDPHNSAAAHMLASLSGKPALRAPRSYVESLYDQHAQTFEQRLVGRLGYRAPQVIAEALAGCSSGPVTPALDIGCGSGLLGQALTQRFGQLEIDGIDLSSRMLALARAKTCYRQLLHGDAVEEMLRLPAGRYQLIASADMLIYLGELGPLFDAVTHALAPGGLVALTVEATTAEQPQLQPSGRFRHSAKYLQRLAAERGLQQRLLQRLDLRQEHDETIEGLLLILQAPTANPLRDDRCPD